jgi:hypothetical protein
MGREREKKCKNAKITKNKTKQILGRLKKKSGKDNIYIYTARCLQVAISCRISSIIVYTSIFLFWDYYFIFSFIEAVFLFKSIRKESHRYPSVRKKGPGD